MTESPPDDEGPARSPVRTLLWGCATVAVVLLAAAAGWLVWRSGRASVEELVAAARAGDVEAVRACLDGGVGVDERPQNPWPVGGLGDSALLAAAGTDHRAVVTALLDAGADVNQASATTGMTPISRAAGSAPPEVVELLLARGADPNAVPAGHAWPALHCAAIGTAPARTRVLEILLERGADPARTMTDGRRAIHVAIEANHLAEARVLAAHDAALGAAPDVFVAAALGPAARLRELLVERPEWVTTSPLPLSSVPLLQLAARSGHAEGVASLLDAGADPDRFIDSRGFARFTALHYAAMEGHLEVARLLLDRGAGADAATPRGVRPLGSAASDGNVEMMRLLLDHGAAVAGRAEGSLSPTALHYAAKRNAAPAVELLLARGADPAATTGGKTPLDWAVAEDNAAAAAALSARR